MTPKVTALALLGAVSLLGPILEAWITGRIEPLSKFDVGLTLVSISLIFWWYHVDKREHDYRAGPLMNAGVVALSMVALPIYFIRSRGWKRGSIAILKGVAVFAAITLLGMLGEWIGKAVTLPA